MGQYYKPINLDKQQYLYSHDYHNGLKLMEHSWVGNGFVNVVEELISEGGAWHGDRIVWAGDYADPEPRKTKRYKDKYDGKMKTRKLNLWDLIDKDVDPAMKIQPAGGTIKNFKYLVNLDTKEFVDYSKIPLSDVVEEDGEEWPFIINPLPLLTCEGNGRGGGDFHKEHSLVGKWARQRVVTTNTKPEGYKEIKFNLYEGKRPAKFKKTAKVTA
jgi:hypothetical protein